MSQFGDVYSHYYDLLYRDKDYKAEVDYVETLVKEYKGDAKTILDLGCGTGRHAELFAEKGYIVHGVDVSKDMLKLAEKRRIEKEDRLTFTQAKIQELRLNKTYDVVVSLFHVLSYQNTNEEVIKFFKAAKEHLVDDGIFIFDFWYGPAVLTEKPTVRVKRFQDDKIRVTRIAEPTIDVQRNIVEVRYSILIEDKNSGKLLEKGEIHNMRFFFDSELELICDLIGLKIVSKNQWMTNSKPTINSWNVVWTAKK